MYILGIYCKKFFGVFHEIFPKYRKMNQYREFIASTFKNGYVPQFTKSIPHQLSYIFLFLRNASASQCWAIHLFILKNIHFLSEHKFLTICFVRNFLQPTYKIDMCSLKFPTIVFIYLFIYQ
jgi:hypothetical protein